MKYAFGNWKEYLTPAQSVRLAKTLRNRSRIWPKGVLPAVFPSEVSLSNVAHVLKGTRIGFGPQDLESPPANLKKLGCTYVIVGHSSRRARGETNAHIAKKLRLVAKHGMTPILCVGEPWAVRQKGKTLVFVRQQLRAALKGFRGKVIVAYEPIWAIHSKGKKRDCAPEDARAIGKRIISPRYPLLYGGSVTAKTAARHVDGKIFHGVLVGFASTAAKEYADIVRNLA